MFPKINLNFVKKKLDTIRRQIMVAEFIQRGQNVSPLNGEIPNSNCNMPNLNNVRNLIIPPNNNNLSNCSSPTEYMHQVHTNNYNNNQQEPQNMPQSQQFANHNEELLLESLMNSNSQKSDSYQANNGYDLTAIKRKELFSQRKQREFIPDSKKDDSYWDRRRRNNEAAKRSREKRRFNDMVLEQKVVELTKENHILKAQLDAIKDKFGINAENFICIDKILASIPTNDQLITITKRPKIATLSATSPIIFQSNNISPIPTPVIHHSVINSPHLQHMSAAAAAATVSYQHENNNLNYHETANSTANAFSSLSYHHQHQLQQQQQQQQQQFYENKNNNIINNNNVLNLSRSKSKSQSRSPSPSRSTPLQSPLETSSGSGDENLVTNSNNLPPEQLEELAQSQPQLQLQLQPPQTLTEPLLITHDDPQLKRKRNLNDINNSLPLKLRHKSHLGDKDSNNANLLENLKQETIVTNSRTSPAWDAEGSGSSDERDSGISMGISEWPTINNAHLHSNSNSTTKLTNILKNRSQLFMKILNNVNHKIGIDNNNEEEDDVSKKHIQSEIERLSSEVASLKSLIVHEDVKKFAI